MDKTFLLRRIDENGDDEEGNWDECKAKAVIASTEEEARLLASLCRDGDEPKDVWLDPKLSRCTQPTNKGVFIIDNKGA